MFNTKVEDAPTIVNIVTATIPDELRYFDIGIQLSNNSAKAYKYECIIPLCREVLNYHNGDTMEQFEQFLAVNGKIL